MEFNSLIPELSVTDINKSKDFYLSLGFGIKYERPENKFIFLQLEGNQIMIEEINAHWSVGEMQHPFGNGINLSMRVSDVNEKYKELKSKGIKMFRELEVMATTQNAIAAMVKSLATNIPALTAAR